MHVLEKMQAYGLPILAPRLMRPTYIGPIHALTPEFCKREGITAYGMDLDGHVIDHDAPAHEIDGETREAVRALGAAGVVLFIVSNTSPKPQRIARMYAIGEQLGVPREHAYTTAGTGWPKPHPDVLLKALADLNVAPDQTLYGGDQPYKDIVVANRAGVRSLLSPRLGVNDDVRVALLQRPAEVVARALMLPLEIIQGYEHLPVLMRNYPTESIIRVSPNP